MDKIVFSSLIASKLNLSESIHTDKGLNELTRSYMNISASHMHTFGGQVRYIEVSYMESSSFSDDFKVLAQYVVTGSDNFEITASKKNIFGFGNEKERRDLISHRQPIV